MVMMMAPRSSWGGVGGVRGAEGQVNENLQLMSVVVIGVWVEWDNQMGSHSHRQHSGEQTVCVGVGRDKGLI